MPRQLRATPAGFAHSADHSRRAAENFAAGQYSLAADNCRAALKRSPRASDLWHLLAVCELQIGSSDEALAAVTRARAIAPTRDDYTNTQALILEQGGARLEAAALWQALLARNPAHADAWYNLGRQLLVAGNTATTAFERALALRPAWVDAWKNLGHARFAAGDSAGAEAAFANALQQAPQDHDAAANLARLREEADDADTAMTLYRRALAAGSEDATLLRYALVAPIFCRDATDISAQRERVLGNLRALEHQPLQIADPARALGNPGFYFAYQGQDELEFQTRLAGLTARAWQPPALTPVSRPSQPRIAFVSAHFKAHTIGRLYAPLVERLPRDGFDLAVVSIGRHDDALAHRYAAAADIYVAVDEDLEAARRTLHALAPDVIFYTDIGMDPWTRYLAGLRLAPVQAMSWGHPLTSGQATMDYFVSSSLIEPIDAPNHYTETLIQLPAWPVLYDRPGTGTDTGSRTDFGFAASERLYLCPQSLFKLQPDFDALLGAILRHDPAGRIVLLETRAPWRTSLEARFARCCADVANRIDFIPPMSSARYTALLHAADVVLDTTHFSGGYTSFETIWAETPFVTMSGRYMRGRVTAGLCTLLGIDGAIASSADDYVERAVSLAHAGPARVRFIEQLRDRKRGLLELDASVLPAYGEFFHQALARATCANQTTATSATETPR